MQGGILSPDEARAAEDLPKVPFGDEPRVQQQVVPLSAWSQTLNKPETTPAPDAPPSPPPADDVNDEPDPDTTKSIAIDERAFEDMVASFEGAVDVRPHE
ncbi:hypothetical protein D3C87_1972090 [compost metagenome]